MVVNYLFHITHDLSVSTLGNIGLLMNGVCFLLEHSCWLRVQDKRNRKKTLLRSVHRLRACWR